MVNNMINNPMFGMFMRNPLQFLLQRKINIPQGYANDPEGATQYLMSTGKMSQDTFEYLRDQASQMGFKL